MPPYLQGDVSKISPYGNFLPIPSHRFIVLVTRIPIDANLSLSYGRSVDCLWRMSIIVCTTVIRPSTIRDVMSSKTLPHDDRCTFWFKQVHDKLRACGILWTIGHRKKLYYMYYAINMLKRVWKFCPFYNSFDIIQKSNARVSCSRPHVPI
jgi:hypothetical protein